MTTAPASPPSSTARCPNRTNPAHAPLLRTVRLIQPREPFGPPERHTELYRCWAMNDAVFSDSVTPAGRPTFTEMFAMCDPKGWNVIANSDIYFEEVPLPPPPRGEVFALSRWDVDASGNPTLWDHADSQDAWIFYGRPTFDAPFTMGVPGCDNVLVHLFRESGYKVRNPSKSIRAYHLHLSKYRSYLDGEGRGRGGHKLYRLPPPYEFAKPEEL